MRWCVLLLLIPAAQGYTLSLDAPAIGPLAADVETAPWPIEYTIDCDGAPAQGPAELTLSVDAAPGIMVVGPDVHLVALPSCVNQQSASGTLDLEVSATGAARGIIPNPVDIAASLRWDTPSGETASNTTGLVTVAFQGRIEVKTPVKLKQGEPGTQTVFPMEVTNFGNAPITLDIVQTQGGPGWSFQASQSPIEVGATATIDLVYANPDDGVWINEENGWAGTFTPISAEDPSQSGDPVTFNLVNRTRGSPAPALPLVVIGLAAMAMAKRR